MPWFVIIHVFQCLPHQHVIHMCRPCSSSGDTRDSLLHACRAPEMQSMTQARFGILSPSSLCSGFEEVKQVALWSEERRAGPRPPSGERGGVDVGRLLSVAAHAPACLDKQKDEPCRTNTNELKRYEGKTGVGRVRARPHLQIITYINNWC